MRGFPPIQIFILGLAFGLLALPLAQLTTGYERRSDSAMESPENTGDPQVVKGGSDHPEGEHKHVEVPSLLRVRFAHAPLTLSLKQEGMELFTQTDLSKSPLEIKANLEINHEGNEVMLSATWPPGTPDTALTVEIEPDGFETRSETRWSSNAALNEVLTYTW